MSTKPTVLMVPRMPATLVAQLETAYRVLGPLEASRPEHLPREAEDVVALLTIGTQTTSASLIDARLTQRLSY